MSDGTGETLLDRRGSTAAGGWQRPTTFWWRRTRTASSVPAISPARRGRLCGRASRCDHRGVGAGAAEGVRAGDHLAAAGAAVRVAMHLLFDTALMAPVRGWLTRAELHLGEGGETPVDAWLAVVRNYERMLTGDVPLPGRPGGRSRSVPAAIRPPPLSAGSRRARSLILDGEVRPELALLEEAGVATTSGELDPLSTGVVYCLSAPCRDSPSMTWPRNGPRPWNGGARPAPSAVSTAAAAAHTPRSSGCAGPATRRRRKRSWPRGATLPSPGARLAVERTRSDPTAQGRHPGAEDALLAAHHAGWDPQPAWPWCVWPRARRRRPLPSGMLSKIRCRCPRRSCPEHRSSSGAAARGAVEDRGRGR